MKLFEHMAKMGMGQNGQLCTKKNGQFIINENAKLVSFYTHSHEHPRSHKLVINKFSLIKKLMHSFASSYTYAYEEFVYTYNKRLASITVP